MSPDAIELKKEVDLLRHENRALKNILKLMQKDRFGSSSERFHDETEQLLFNEIEVEAGKAPEQEEFEIIGEHKRLKKGRGKKKPFPEDIKREELIIDIAEKDKVCPHDGTELKFIGYEVTEKLKCIPAQMSIIEEKKAKYACPCCEGHVVQAKSPSILPKTIATPELLSFICFSKFYQGLPLYRVEELFKLQKIDCRRGTMAHWLIRASEKLQPIWNILEERAIESGYMVIDATKVQVLKEQGRRPETKSAMWVRGSPEKNIVLFDYNKSEAGYVAKNLMTGFEGALQADAHPGYDALEREKVLLLGCMMHSRRRFNKAWLRVDKKAGLAKDALRKFKKLYKFEEAYKEQGLTDEQRHQARLKEVKPFLEKMHEWMVLQRQKVLPSSDLGDGFNYFIKHYEELTNFLKSGRYEVDNGWCERVIRKFAIGRKNWLFNDTIDGAKASSLFYSLVITAKLNGKDPFDVMAEIFRQLPRAETIDDFEKLADLLTD